MNPLIFLGLGALAFMAMGKKKPAPVENGFDDDDDSGDDAPPVQQFVASKIEPKKTTMFAKAGPLNYKSTIAQGGGPEAKQCRLQGVASVEQITVCIANKLFPAWDWTNRSGWQVDAWSRMRVYALIELGLPPNV